MSKLELGDDFDKRYPQSGIVTIPFIFSTTGVTILSNSTEFNSQQIDTKMYGLLDGNFPKEKDSSKEINDL